MKYWKELLLAVLLAVACSLAYEKVYSLAEQDVSAKYDKHIAEFQSTVLARISDLQDSSRVIVIQNDQKAKELNQTLAAILTASQGKPLTIIKDGKCTPSDDFVDSYNSLVNAGNPK